MPRKRRERQVAVYKKGSVPRGTLSLEKAASNDQAVSRMQLGAQGYDGLRSNYGRLDEFAHAELRWPESICTYKKMSLDPTVSAVNNFYNMMIARAEFEFKAPVYSDEKPFNPEGKNYTKIKLGNSLFQALGHTVFMVSLLLRSFGQL